MAKYDPLASHLAASGRPCSMTFAEIDHLVGGVPPSARTHRAWWANARSHVQALAWLSHDRLVGDVDIGREVVRFD